jgi:hypothetical protein
MARTRPAAPLNSAEATGDRPPRAARPLGSRAVDDRARDDEVLLLLRQVLVRGDRRWRRGDVIVFADRIVAAHPEGIREIPIAGILRVARQKKVFTGVRLTVEAERDRLQVRALTPAAAATAQRIIAETTRRSRS